MSLNLTPKTIREQQNQPSKKADIKNVVSIF